MLQKYNIIMENKIVSKNFFLDKTDTSLIICMLDKHTLVKVPIYNKYNGINYIPISFPIVMPIIDGSLFNPYIIISSYNFDNENELDFFYLLKKSVMEIYGLKLYSMADKMNIIDIINKYYITNIEMDNMKESYNSLDKYISILYENINIIKLGVIYLLNMSKKERKQLNIPKKLHSITNKMIDYKYNLYSTNLENIFSLPEYFSINFSKELELSNIKVNCYYFININNSESTDIITSTNNIDKIIKVYVKKINKLSIEIENKKILIFENYKWYYFHTNLKIDNSTIIFQTNINNNFTNNIICSALNIDIIHARKIIDYYEKDNMIDNIISLNMIFTEVEKYLDDMAIILSMKYSDIFFEYIVKKYTTTEKIYEILSILFENYSYPLKMNRNEIDSTFIHIIYISLLYKNLNIYDIIPNKLKNLYTNILKLIIELIEGKFEMVKYNKKIYSDYLSRTIIKIIFGNSKNIFIIAIKNMIKQCDIDKFKYIYSTNILLMDIGYKLNWINIPKKLNYIMFYYKNKDIIYYIDKLNRNIIPDNFDNRIKRVIENPYEMYKHLKKDKDFIKWTKFISDKIPELYNNIISLSSNDITNIGMIIYLLFNIVDQNMKDPSYINFINFCSIHNRLILDNDRINLKIREHFPNLKSNLNLGYLTKAILSKKNSDETNINILEYTTKKYNKYKIKYIEFKKNNYVNENLSETSL